MLDSSNIPDKVGKAFVSTLFSASVMQYSAVRGGNNDTERVDRSNGILFMRKDLITVVA